MRGRFAECHCDNVLNNTHLRPFLLFIVASLADPHHILMFHLIGRQSFFNVITDRYGGLLARKKSKTYRIQVQGESPNEACWRGKKVGGGSSRGLEASLSL
jgi:hypothetical protein